MNTQGMAEPLMKVINVIVSHDNCPDGLAAAMIAASTFPNAAVKFVEYNRPSWLELPAEPGMLFVDMSPPKSRVAEFKEVGAFALDHHVTAREVVEALSPRGVYREDACGALLTHREVYGRHLQRRDPEVAHFAEVADVRDRWLKDSPLWVESGEQAAALMMLDRDALLAQARAGRPFLSIEQMVFGQQLQKRRMRDAVQAADKAIIIPACGLNVAFVNDNAGIISDAAEVLRQGIRRIDVAVGFRMSEDDQGFVRTDYSLRSNDKFDCAAFCKKHGGGGHARAAGCNAQTRDPIGHFLHLLTNYL